MPIFADKLVNFYKQLQPPDKLPKGVEVLYPQKDPKVMKVVKKFCQKYYNDNSNRRLILGINPGRFGAGITGVNFTAPRQLKEQCGINHPFNSSSELSAEFIYDVINAYGGANTFYKDWFIGAVCPLGFIKDGINMNYYDDKKLQQSVTAFITQTINQQLSMGLLTDHCICIGGEKNYKFLSNLNDEHNWFEKITPLPHPRFILQYRRKQKEEYVKQYLAVLREMV